MNSLRVVWHNNSLSIVLISIFLATLIGMSIAGWYTANNEAQDFGEAGQSYVSYLGSGDFIEGVFENWESEFLQMWALVVFTIWLRQKGADDSKPLRGKTPQDTSSRYSILTASTWSAQKRAIKHSLYSHSLSIALLILFVGSFTLHAVGGASMYNEEAARFGDTERVTPFTYIGTSQFWYESLQNWQSEFFAVAVLLLLSIKLRERGSPESKPVGKTYNRKTGS